MGCCALVSTSETSTVFYQTARHIQEDSYLHNRCCENLKCNLLLLWLMKRIRWEGYLARVKVIRNGCQILLRKPEGNITLWINGRKCDGTCNMKIGLIRYQSVDWLHLVKWRTFLNNIMKLSSSIERLWICWQDERLLPCRERLWSMDSITQKKLLFICTTVENNQGTVLLYLKLVRQFRCQFDIQSWPLYIN